MTTHQYLNQIYRLQKKIDTLELYEERLRDEAEKVTSAPFDKIRVSGSATHDASAIIARIADCEAELVAVKIEMISMRNDIVNEIQHLNSGNALRDGLYMELLTRRYVLFEKFPKIAQEMNFTEKHIFRLRNEAHAVFEKQYGDKYVDA